MGFLESAGSFLKGGMQKSYRIGTLYDFSVLVRARLIVYEYNEPMRLLESEEKEPVEDFKFVEVLPFQINPTGFNKSKKVHDSKFVPLGGIGNINPERDSNSVIVVAKFNIEDEYMAATQNATIPLNYNIDELTIISKLYEYADPAKYRVMLKWGPLSYLAMITSIDCQYDSFSPYGEPLSADVTITLERHSISKRVKGSPFSTKLVEGTEDTLSSQLSWTQSGKTDSALVASQLVIDKAASESLPAIIRSMRS